MLRLALLVLIITLAIIPFAVPTAVTSERLRRITTTPSQSLNINPMLSDDGRFVFFESSVDLANVGGLASFHTIRANIGNDAVSYEDIASSRSSSTSVSSNGLVVAFASTEDLIGQNVDRNSEIYVFDGDHLRQITNTTADTEVSRLTEGNFSPSISSDGRYVAFSTNRYSQSSTSMELFLFDTQQGTRTQLTQSPAGQDAVNPKLSGDAGRVFYVQTKSGIQDVHDLIVLDIQAGSKRVLVSDVEGMSITAGRAISRDGMRIVYSARTAPNETQVFLFDLNDQQPRQLTQLGSRTADVNLNPTISGDGKRIAFSTRRKVINSSDGSVELYLLDIPTGEIQQISSAPSTASAEVVASLNFNGSAVVFSFPRVLSGPVNDSVLANNPEIYLAAVEPRPEFGKATVVNAASRNASETRIAPESIAVVTGNQLCSGREQAKLIQGSLPETIKGTTVQVNAQRARLFYVSPEEVVFLVPPNVPEGSAEVVVTNSEGFPSRAIVDISRTAPGVFSANGEAIILDSKTLVSGPFDPTEGNLSLMIFATGSRNASTLAVSIAGELLPVDSLVPSTLPGLDELHLRVPAALRGAGTVPISIIANDVVSNVCTTTVAGSALRDIMINEVLTDPPDGIAGDANHDGTRDSAGDEFVELVNSTTRDIDLSGYQLLTHSLTSSTETVRHRFAQRTVLAAGTALVVFGGGVIDQDRPEFGSAQVVRASSGGLSLNNSGGVVTLRSSDGAVITSITYGSGAGLPGDANQSLTRFPDVSGSLALHQLVSEMQAFSPGTRVNGSPFSPSPAVTSILVSPSTAELLKGAQEQFFAKAFDSASNQLADVLFNWHSSNESIVTIDASGIAKGISPGTVEIIATGRGMSSSAAIVNVISPTPTPTPTPFASPSPSPSASPTPSPSPTTTPSPSPSVTPIPTPTPSPSPLQIALVISEFRTRGPNGASDEFVEIYNHSDSPVNAGGLKIRGSSGTGTITTRLTISANTIIPARGHFLASNSGGYSGSVSGDQSFTSGFANDGGIALTTTDDTIIDQVGMSAGSAFKEGDNLSTLPTDTNQSYERKPGGFFGSNQDTQNNLSDFQLLSPSDPQNTFSNPTPGPGPSPSPTPVPTSTPTPSPTSATGVVISQVFGGGGNSGAPFRNDFIEIFNAGSSNVDLSGWSVQYASATASTWSVTTMAATTLLPGQYYLIQEGSGGTNGIDLPTPDTIGSISLAAGSGKVALVRSMTALSGACPVDSNIADFVGYGTTANCFEGTGPAPAPSNSMAIARGNSGCTDTAKNSLDFTLTGPAPRNTSSSLRQCSAFAGTSSELTESLVWFLLLIWQARFY